MRAEIALDNKREVDIFQRHESAAGQQVDTNQAELYVTAVAVSNLYIDGRRRDPIEIEIDVVTMFCQVVRGADS